MQRSEAVWVRAPRWMGWVTGAPRVFVDGIGIVATLAWGAAAVVVLFCVVILAMSFVEDFPLDPALGLANYLVLLDPFTFQTVLPNTLVVGLGSVAVVLFFSVPLAWLMNRTDLPGQPIWVALIASIVMVPGFLRAMGWLLLLSPKIGAINFLLSPLFGGGEVPLSVNNVWGIAFIQGLSLTPSMFFLLSGPMRSLDPSMEEAARVSGGSARHVVWRISMPLLWPAILGGAIYSGMTAIAVFEVASVLDGFGRNAVLATMLALSIQSFGGSDVPNFGAGGVYGLLIILPTLVGLHYYFKVVDRERGYEVVTGKAYRASTRALGRWKWAGLAFVGLYLMLAFVLPFLLLLWQSLVPTLRFPSAETFALMSFDNYGDALDLVGTSAIFNSIVVSVVAAVVTVLLGFMIAWVVVRTRVPGRRLLDAIAMLPHAVPGIGFAFAAAMMDIFMRKWVPGLAFGNTIWILVLVFAITRLSYVTRVANAALVQISQELEDAAYVNGATKMAAIRSIVVPLVWSSLLYTMTWSALLIFHDASIAIMLGRPRSQMVASQIWFGWTAGQENAAAAAGVVLVASMLMLVFLVRRFGTSRWLRAS